MSPMLTIHLERAERTAMKNLRLCMGKPDFLAATEAGHLQGVGCWLCQQCLGVLLHIAAQNFNSPAGQFACKQQ